MENIEKRSQQCLKVLTVVLVGGEARLKFGARLRKQSLAVNLQQFGGLLRGVVFSPKLKGDLLRSALPVRCENGSGPLRPAPVRDAVCGCDRSGTRTPKAEHVIGAELCGVGALPHVLHIEVRIEILVGKIDLQFLLLNHLLRASNLWVLGFRRGEEFVEGVWKRCLGKFGGFYVR